MRAICLSAVLLACVAACSSFGTEAPVGAADAGGGVDAGDAGMPPFVRSTFEEDDGACGGLWRSFTSTTVKRVAKAGVDGSFACEVCSAQGAGSFFGIDTSIYEGAAGTSPSFELEADVRDESAGKIASMAGAFVVKGVFLPGSESTGAGWNHVVAVLPAGKGGTLYARVAVRAVAPPTCVLVDNIVVRKLEK